MARIKVHSSRWCCKTLEQVLSDDEAREELVRELLRSHVRLERLVELRFVNAVSEFERTHDQQEKAQKGVCICNVFLCDGARYRLEIMTPELTMRLTNNFTRTVSQMKKQVLSRLAGDETVAHFLYDHAGSMSERKKAMRCCVS